jgi:hypothetical protein
MNKSEKIAALKLKYLTINKNVNGEVIELDAEEYAETIARWADAELAQEAEIAKEQSDATAKAALLAQLGITEEQAKLLLS